MAKKATSRAEETPKAQAAGMPLFFKAPAVLDSDRHKKASLRGVSDVGFAKATNSLPLNAIEFLEAVKSYPIVFTADEITPMPVAIVGLEQTNYFVGKDNKWSDGHYIPAYARQYPFIFFQPPNSDKFYLCVDEESPHFSAKQEKDAMPLYTDAGEPSPTAKQALEFCTAFYQHLNITKEFCADLEKHKLLQPYGSKVTLANGREIQLGGFRMIDETAFNALPEKTFLEFRSKGWLAFIYMAMASTSNWKRLLDLANQQAAN